MYCNHCGTQLPEGAAFCHNCGKQIGAVRTGRQKKLLILAVGAAAILAAVLLIVSFRGKPTAGPEPETAAPTQSQTEETTPEPAPEPEPVPEAEPVASPEADPGPPCAPDPDTFFGTADGMGSSKLWMAHFSDDPKDAVSHYLCALRDVYGMELVYAKDEDNYQQRSMQKGDDENAFVTLELDAADDGTWFLWLKYGEPVELVQAEIWDQPLTEVVYTPEPEPEVSDPAVLPDFLAHDSSDSFRLETTSSDDVVAFLSDNASVRHVTENYVQLLLDMGYYVTDTEEKSYLYRWYLTHDDVGGGTVQGSAQVCVKHMTYTTFGKTKTEVSITFGSGVTYAGDSKTGSGGGSGTSSGSSDTRTPCSICNRTGNCQTCGGDGYLWSSAADKENRNCYSCRNGKCTNCNGTGWRD